MGCKHEFSLRLFSVHLSCFEQKERWKMNDIKMPLNEGEIYLMIEKRTFYIFPTKFLKT